MSTIAELPVFIDNRHAPSRDAFLAAVKAGHVVSVERDLKHADGYICTHAHIVTRLHDRPTLNRAIAHFDRPVYLYNNDTGWHDLQNTGAEPYAAHLRNGRDAYLKVTRSHRHSDEPATETVEIVTMSQPKPGNYVFGLEFHVAALRDADDAPEILAALNMVVPSPAYRFECPHYVLNPGYRMGQAATALARTLIGGYVEHVTDEGEGVAIVRGRTVRGMDVSLAVYRR